MSAASAGPDRPLAFSVIVATRNRPESLRGCLASLVAIDRSDFEVIVVDQSPDDASEEVVRATSDARVVYVRRTTPGKEAAQNAAVPLARAPLLAFTDDDCEVSSDWLDSLAAAFADPSVAVVYGAVTAPPHDAAAVFVPTFVPARPRRIASRWFPAHRCGIGANMAVRRTVFDELGGFETNMGPGSRYRSGGDWEIAHRALRRHKPIVQAPSAVVLHHGGREYADGQVRRLISNNYFGIGAGYGLHARAGDVVAIAQVVREAVSIAATIVVRLVRNERPLGARRLMSTMQGFATAMRKGRAGPPPS